ncbi:MAG TPA: BatD family protein [Puia sp.]|nr:BatD family protein [Puia sp.]
MKRNLKYISWIFPLSVACLFGFSQNQISVTATANRNQILIGEPVQLTLEVRLPLGRQMSWFVLDSIPHFEYIEKGKIDSVVNEDGKSFRQDVTLTSFDSGTFVIPSLALMINNQKYLTDSIRVQVSFSKINPGQDYHDIKDIIDVESPSVRYAIWIVIGVTVMSILLFTYFILKKKKIAVLTQQTEIPRLSPYEEAMEALTALESQDLPGKGQVKSYYTQLNDIFRKYVLRKLQIASLSKTNDELIMQLRIVNLPREKFSQLAESLRMSDFVKFAKYIPGNNDNDHSFKVIRSSIDIINEIDRSAL